MQNPETKDPPITTGPASFDNVCLYCGRKNHSDNYTCDCRKDAWFHQYRTLDLKPDLNPSARALVEYAFQNYRFDDSLGILQYPLLPLFQVDDSLPTVGMTPMHHLKALSEWYGTTVFIKDEGQNPSGCFKDRETLMALLNTQQKQLDQAVIYSSGNAAASAAIFAQSRDMNLVTFVSGDTYEEKISFIRDHGSDVVVVGDAHTSFEEGFRFFSALNFSGVFHEEGYDNWSVRNPYRVQGDKTTALEIVKQLSATGKDIGVPDYVIIPTANGSCLTGVWKGFMELRAIGMIDKLPRMVSAGIRNASPVYKAVKRRQILRPEHGDIDHLDPLDAEIGSTILAEEGYDSMEAARAILESGGDAVEVTARDIQTTFNLFLSQEKSLAIDHGILPEPASIISLSAIQRLKRDFSLGPEDVVVSLITGHGMKAQRVVTDLLQRSADKRVILEIIEKKEKQSEPKAFELGKRLNVAADFHKVANAFSRLKDT